MVLALSGLVTLLVAIFTDSTYAAFVVVGLAVSGIALLVRDWRADHKQTSADETADVAQDEPIDPAMSPEMFAPDISGNGRGPSSDARAD
ncbi:hypothetical protein AB431_00240 [Mycobacterium sp. EPa45]|nr:hypothetical protein AB431_00240 [Mycobacterium sp. EPa45]